MRRKVDPVGPVVVIVALLALAWPARAEHEAPLWTSAPRHKPTSSASAFADPAARARAPRGFCPRGVRRGSGSGERVLRIGNRFDLNQSVAAGIVSAKERVVDRSTLREPKQQDLYSFFIQTDASINLGNSGGPLID